MHGDGQKTQLATTAMRVQIFVHDGRRTATLNDVSLWESARSAKLKIAEDGHRAGPQRLRSCSTTARWDLIAVEAGACFKPPRFRPAQ